MSIVSYRRLSFVVCRRIVCRNGIFLVFFIWYTVVVRMSIVITGWGNEITWWRGVTNTSRWKITNRDGCFSPILQTNVGQWCRRRGCGVASAPPKVLICWKFGPNLWKSRLNPWKYVEKWRPALFDLKYGTQRIQKNT